MDPLNHVVATIALTMGAAWASGINLYAAILVLGLLGTSGNIVLPPDLQVLATPLVIAAAGVMYCIEFVADKIPGVDNGWDTIHTFVRIPAGALLAAGAVGHVDPALAITAGLVGGGMAASSHITKAGTRVLINASPEPFTNWSASLGEDLMVVAGLWTALHYPWLFIVFLLIFIIAMVWLLPRLWAAIRKMLGFITRLFGARTTSGPSMNSSHDDDRSLASGTGQNQQRRDKNVLQ